MDIDFNMNDKQGSWFTLLGWIGIALAVLSLISNVIIIIILSKNKITSDTLVNFRLCTCADILCTVLFLVFTCPSWLHDKMIFNAITCTVEGVISKWMGLALHYSWVYLMFQRYCQSRKEIGWKESRPCFVSPVLIIWLFFCAIVVLPFAHNKAPYSYNHHLSQCVLSSRWMFLAYDILHYVIPSVLLFVAGVLLKSLQSKPVTRFKVSGTNLNYNCAQCPPMNQLSSKLSPRRYIQIEEIFAQYTELRHWKWKKVSTLLLSSLENKIMGLETRLSFIYISYASSIFIITTFIFRMYGTWLVPTSKLTLSASHVFPFIAGIVRSVIPLLVNTEAKRYLSRRVNRIVRKSKNRNYLVIPPMEIISIQRKLHDIDGKRNLEDFWFKNVHENNTPCTISASNNENSAVFSAGLSTKI